MSSETKKNKSGRNDRRTLSEFIMDKLFEVEEMTLEALFPSNRVEGRFWRQILGLPGGYEFSRRSFSALLNRFKRDGLVVKKGSGKGSIWSLSSPQRKRLQIHRNQIQPAPSDDIPRLVMYDIPETERKKRDWLRYELVACDYKQLQKSVWLGYRPLPHEFMDSLKDLKLMDKVHIVSIHRQGTVQEF